MKRKYLNKIFILLICILTVALVTTLICVNINKDDKNTTFKINTEQYNSTQKQIVGYDIPTSTNTINMSDLYIVNNDSITKKDISVEDKTINIRTALDLYAFSYLANSYDSFLAYKYQLLNNIDYSITSNEFIPIAYATGKAFTGQFNGNGYEITNLTLKVIDNNTAFDTDYFAMFSKLGSGAEVTNFGLINTNIIINKTMSDCQGVAAAVGLIGPGAKVSYIFARDLREPVDDEAGITAAGGYRISGLVFRNEGTLQDCYTYYSIIVNYTVDDYIDFCEILTEQEGTSSHIYFYNDSIKSYTEPTSENPKYEIEYKSPVNKTLPTLQHYGVYCNSSSELISNLTGYDVTLWKYKNAYGNLSNSLLKLVSPITRYLNFSYDGNIQKYTCDINNVKDFCYMFELMNLNSIFASDSMIYNINSDIDLSMLLPESYYYKYGIASTISGSDISGSVTLEGGTKSTYPTIYDAKLSKYVTTEGIDCYGVFPWLTGSIEKLNFVFRDANPQTIQTSTTNNIKAIGMAVGYCSDNATIKKINTYGSVTINNSIGKYFAGGITGLLSDEATISNSTSAGTITTTSGTYSNSYDINDYIKGCVIGGSIGYTTDTSGTVHDILNTVDINALESNSDIAIGGVIGAGYTNFVFNLENRGSITVGNTYPSLFTGGVLGRLVGMTSQINAFTNKGNIIVTPNASNSTYIAGILNADITATATSYLSQSKLKSNNKIAFFASGCTNSGTLNINSTAANLECTSGININSKNGFISELSGIYNLKNDINQIIDMHSVSKYAPVLNVISSNSNQTVDIETAYNFRNIDFTTSDAISSSGSDLIYSGCVLGKYINYKDVRNEGDISFAPSNSISCRSIIAVGVLEEVSSDFEAQSIFNGGNISLDCASSAITGNVCFSGICYSNKNGFSETEIQQFNPLSSSFDSNKRGSLNDVINNGDITITNSNYQDISFTYDPVYSSNHEQLIGVSYAYTAPTKYITGNTFIAGIVYDNESVITNTFNLGDILNANYANGNYQLLSAGISTYNISKNSYILNSANNGIIKTINLSTNIGAKAYSSGISCRNDINADGTNYKGGSNHANQVISFTINYGSIFSYNYANNVSSSADEPRTNSSGILSLGLCNVINVVNYGNIYSSENSSGIFGVVYFEKFTDDVSSTNIVNISNSINYGNVYVLEKGENLHYDVSSYRLTYSAFKGLTDLNINKANESEITHVPTGISGTNATYTEKLKIKPIYAKLYIERTEGVNFYIGSIFSIINFNNDTNANNVKIRYLISFNKDVKILAFEAGTPSTVISDVSKIYSSYYAYIDGEHTFSEYMGQNVVYAPLNSNDDNTIGGTDYKGVFSTNFEFRQAIEGKIKLDNEHYPTDKFITDYFQFVNYQKINPVLLDKIGWRTLAYLDAANSFAMSLEGTKLFYTYYKGKISLDNYNNIDVTNALSTGTWSLYADSDVLLQSVEEILSDSSNTKTAQDIINYIFSSSNNILINNSFKSNLIKYILENVDDNILDRNDLLTFDGSYSTVLAEVLCSDSDNDVKTYVKGQIDTIISSMDVPSTKEDLLIAYNDYLVTEVVTEDGKSLFTNTSSTARYNLLYDFFDSISDEDFYTHLKNLLSSESKTIIAEEVLTDVIKQYDGYNRLINTEIQELLKQELFESIISSNNETEIDTYLSAFAAEINVYDELSISSFDDIFSLIAAESTSATDANTISQRVDLYNKIRNTKTFSSYLSSIIPNSQLYEATEHNNTFQSNVAPNNDGTTAGNVGYSYTTTVTPSTYFYGPYTDKGDRIHSDAKNKNQEDAKIFGKDKNNGYYHMFMTTDKKTYDEFRTAEKITEGTIFRYEYGTQMSNNQFTKLGGGLYTKNEKRDIDDFPDKQYYVSDFTGCQLKVDKFIYLVDDAGVTFSTSGASISPIFLDKHYSSFTSDSTDTGKYFIIDANGKKHYITSTTAKVADGQSVTIGNNGNINMICAWYKLYQDYGIDYYMAQPIKGKYYTANGDNEYGTGILLNYDNINWFTLKKSITAAKTSQYIKYNASQLLLLDGVYSTYGDKTTKCEGERTIINSLFNSYFLTNIEKFKEIVKKSLFESLGISSDGTNSTVNNSFIDNMIISNINSKTTIGSNTSLEYLKCNITYNETTYTTVADYLKARCIFDNKTSILAAASSNKAVFCDLIDILYNQTKNATSDTSDSQIAVDGYTPTDLEIPITFDGVTYAKSFTFNSMEFKLNSTDKAIKLVLSNTGGRKELAYEFYDSEGNVIEIGSEYKQFKTIQSLAIPIPEGASKVKITASEKVISIYAVYTLNKDLVTYDVSGSQLYIAGYNAAELAESISIDGVFYTKKFTFTSIEYTLNSTDTEIKFVLNSDVETTLPYEFYNSDGTVNSSGSQAIESTGNQTINILVPEGASKVKFTSNDNTIFIYGVYSNSDQIFYDGNSSQIIINNFNPTNLIESISFDNVTYTKKFTFDSIEFNLTTTDTEINLVLNSDVGKTLSYDFYDSDGTVKLSGSETIQSTGNQIITISIPEGGASKVKFTPSDNTISIYELYTNVNQIISNATSSQIIIDSYTKTDIESVSIDGITYTNKFTFKLMEFNLNEIDREIKFVLNSDTVTTLPYEFYDSNGAVKLPGSKVIESTGNQTITILVPEGVTKVRLTPNDNPISIYGIYKNVDNFIYDKNGTSLFVGELYEEIKNDYTKIIKKDNLRIVGNVVEVIDTTATNFYTTPTEDELKQCIKTNNPNIDISNIEIVSSSLKLMVYSTQEKYFIVSSVNVDTNGNLAFSNHYYGKNSGVNGNKISANTTDTVIINNAFGTVLTILANNGSVPNNWGSGNIGKDNIYFSASELYVLYKIKGTNSTNVYKVTYNYKPNRTLLESTDDYSPLNIVNSIIKNTEGYEDFTRNLITYMTPLDAATTNAEGNPNIVSKYQRDLFDSDFYEFLAKNSNDFMLKIISKSDNKKDILNYFIDNNYKFYDSFIESYLDSEKSSTTLSDNQKFILASTYLASDYKKIYETSLSSTTTNLANTLLYTRLLNFNDAYQYINSDGSINNDKFDAFASLIGYNTGTSGYGIFALSSSKGILNGEFIPDNLVLSSMNAKYNSNFELDSSVLSAWRGGTSTNPNDISDENSVNYAVLNQMKQLIKSISTTIFTLDLVDSEGTTHYSSESTIDLENHTITYYVPKGYFTSADETKMFTIDENTLSIANLATLVINNGTLNIKQGTNSNVIRVIAEDVNVFNDYSIIFEEIDISFSLSYDSDNSLNTGTFSNDTITIDPTGDIVVLKVTSPVNAELQPLPRGMDLAPYISIISKDSNNNISLYNDKFEYLPIDDNHIMFLNESGESSYAIIAMNILSTLPSGNYSIRVKIFEKEKSIALTKSASSECDITSFVYQGKQLVFDESNELTTMIPFGRAFDSDEFDINDKTKFYLDSIEVSTGATITISTTYAVDTNTNIATYTINYKITAEDRTFKTYIHSLVEKNPLSSYNEYDEEEATTYSYAVVHKDGTAIGTYNSTDNPTSINVNFNRGEEPQYRIKYSFTNMYAESDAVLTYILTGGTGTTYDEAYHGMLITISDNCDPAAYEYTYTYKSSGTWGDEPYYRSYTFPKLVITKEYSTDATIKKLTFLDTNATLGNLATVFHAEKSLRPCETDLTDEVNYFDYRGTAKSGIVIDNTTKKIDYSKGDTDYSASLYKDYFVVGAISNANLSDYAPSFMIEDHAEIYQYTTTKKLTKYGNDSEQADTDYTVLTNHDDLFIYVPYVNQTDLSTEIFLIKVVNGKWTDVYTDDYDGKVEGEESSAYVTTLKDSSNKGDIVKDGISYIISDVAGKTKTKDAINTSLYMDYIGTPLENHFWYVSYVVFSEYDVQKGTINNCKYYHLSLIDNTNTIYFELTVNTPVDFDQSSIYLTISENIYSKNSEGIEALTSQKQISAYAVYSSSSSTETTKVYLLNNNLQILPNGYFYFYVDLPDGYVATFEITNGRSNTNDKIETEIGAYLPPSSIVTQRVMLTINIEHSSTSSDGSWGVSVADIFTRQATEVIETN